MRNIFRISLIILAALLVGLLGYTAYSLMSKTLVFPFTGTEKQVGSSMQIVVSPPKLGSSTQTPLLDESAIRSSIRRSDAVLDSATVSGEYRIIVGQGGYASIETTNPKKTDTPIILDADLYNEKKTTPYELPRDIMLTPLAGVPMSLEIRSRGEPRERTYDIEMYGIPDTKPTDIRYYAHYDSVTDCSIMSWGHPVVLRSTNEKGMPESDVYQGDPWIYREIDPEVISPNTQNGQKWQATIRLPYDMSASRVCIIAGVAGQYRLVEDRLSEPFTATGRLSTSLSPLLDMKSQVDIDFSHDIYSDTGSLYSPEYIAHRRDAKIAFLKHLDISPHLDITDTDLMLTPDRAVITLPFAVSTDYEVKLRDIEDIYGRKTSLVTPVRVESEPFLSLALTERKQIYTTAESIEAKVYALKTPKNTYTLKLCSIPLDHYARIERMLSNQTRAKNSMVAEILDKGRECRTREVVLSGSGYATPFRADDIFTGEKKPGLYVLALSESDPLGTSNVSGEGAAPPRFLAPLIFAVVDTHITMKVDASGKMMFLATDIMTGKPRVDQSITLARNISRTHTEKWNPGKQVVEKEYIPLSAQGFATGVIIGRTDAGGYADTRLDTLKGVEGYDSTPYSLAFESWWDYEGRYDSFLVESRGDGHLGYLVSTWNDGITGYNFGIKDSDYSYSSRGRYTSYLHTDRRLYLPGETVHVHAILRENIASLTIPKETPFDLIITDPLGREVKRGTYKTNDFGSISLDYILSKESTLGMYTINISVPDSTDYIEHAYGNFQVEVFKNPTFTASVELKSDDLTDGAIRDLRKIKNTDPYTPWYTDVYSGDMVIQGIVRAKYYNGAEMKNMPFTYRVYRSVSYPEGYWGDCFWGCYYEPGLELYTEGSGSIDSDGYGVMRIPVEYQSAYDDYAYTVEVTIRDELSGESVTTPSSLIVKLPLAYKEFNPDNPLVFTPKKKILRDTESLMGSLKPTYGEWDQTLSKKYRYEVMRRDYDETWVDDIRTGQTRVTTSKDTIVMSGVIDTRDITLQMAGSKAGEYHLRVIPNTENPPESSITDTIFYITGGPVALRDSTLRVIPERTVYRAGETARVMIQVPFTGSYLLITKEKGGVTDREYTYLSGNTLTREYTVDDTMLPNAYIGVVALRPGSPKVGGRSYAVGYAEIVTDIVDKKSILTIKPEKEIYKNQETANIDVILTDRAGTPLEGEVTLMVVDESLIRILGNIDLDIIPKFYQKFPFTVKTALSAIGIERGQYLSRKGSSGGGGNKGGGGLALSSRTVFENTAYYNSSILTDKSGKARVSFTLPDNITDYRIIAIANTKDSKFSASEKTISIRKDYVIEPHVPMVLYPGDTSTFQIQVFNSTKRITDAELVLTLGTGSGKIVKTSPISLGATEKKGLDFAVTIPSSLTGVVSYTVELKEKEKTLDSLVKSLRIASPPILTKGVIDIRLWTGKTLDVTLPVSTLSGLVLTRSKVEVSISDSFLPEFERGLGSLIQYPYGCIEQTIASTFPNRVALAVADTYKLTLDREKATKNSQDGIAKILRMQHISGGWTYWEGSTEVEAHITPYVIRTLLRFRDLGETVPSAAIESGVNYILANEGIYSADMESLAEAVWTLAIVGNSQAENWWRKIDPAKLSRHGYLAYVTAASKLGKYNATLERSMKERLASDNTSTWYWNARTDSALFAQLLYDRGEREKAIAYLYPLLGKVDVESYYTSTQEKIQYLLALIAEAKHRDPVKSPQPIALRGDALIGDLSVSAGKPTAKLSTSRDKIGKSYSLKRDVTSTLIVISRVHDVLSDITRTPPYTTGGIDISRTFEEIDESAGVDRMGQYMSAKEVRDYTFVRGKLYRVKLSARLATTSEDSWSHLAIEDFFPGAYRPINKTFSTESSLIANQQDEGYWSYNESKDDRTLAHLMYGWGNTRTYTYYFRPESVGDYLLPPATAYFMYDPDKHAYTGFARVKVVE